MGAWHALPSRLLITYTIRGRDILLREMQIGVASDSGTIFSVSHLRIPVKHYSITLGGIL